MQAFLGMMQAFQYTFRYYNLGKLWYKPIPEEDWWKNQIRFEIIMQYLTRILDLSDL